MIKKQVERLKENFKIFQKLVKRDNVNYELNKKIPKT